MQNQPQQPQQTSPVPPAATQPGITVAGRHFGLPWIIGAVAALLVLVCGCCGTFALVSQSGPNNSAVTRATATTNQVATTPHATATQLSTGASPVLGAPGQAFIAKYGPLTNQSDLTRGDLHFQEYPGVAQDYLIVEDGQYYGITPGDTAAYSILVSAPPGQPWDPTTAKQVCTGFMPADAHYVKRVATVGSQGTADGWDDIYLSGTLAKTFPASSFQDASQNPAPVGSFDIMYLYPTTSDTAHVDSCMLFVGEQQTKG